MKQVYFIGGASGSGKTTILADLQKSLQESFAIFDFDDIGVREHADTQWR